MTKVPASGPRPADVMLVGEAPGSEEVRQLRPFCGSSGVELTRMLQEAGFLRSECFITNVCKYQPPRNKIEVFFAGKREAQQLGLTERDGLWPKKEILEGLAELETDIATVKPKIIIAFGRIALWALTGKTAIGDWRGSIMRHANGAYIIPCYHPAAILRNWEWRYITVMDLQRGYKLLTGSIHQPEYSFIVSPSFQQVCETLDRLLIEAPHVSFDIETLNNQIACIGLAWSKREAICIPFIDTRKADKSYWSAEEELHIVERLRDLFNHSLLPLSAQNGLFDIQHICRQWGVVPRLWRDTMIVHHAMLPGTPKSLDYLSSFYLDWHEYWKHESEEWERGIPEEKLWVYNCKDAVITHEIAELQSEAIEKIGFQSSDFGSPITIQMSLVPIVLATMLRGVRIDTKLKRELILELDGQIAMRQDWINQVVGRELNVRSPKQLQIFFYEELKQKVIINHKTGRPTTNDDALNRIAEWEPLLGPLVACINELRQLLVAQSFCAQPLDTDRRMRCSYNIAGTETFRFSSSKDAFGFGTNLQNVTIGSESAKRKWEAEHPGQPYPHMWVPNLRRLFTPDIGYIGGEFDLKSADAQVVAAEAGEWELLQQLIDPNFDLHSVNADRWHLPRQVCKSAVHGTNYGATPFGLAKNLGIKQSHAEMIQADWFARYPGVEEWHKRIQHQLLTRRFVENRFGYRRFYFDRVDNLLKEALAWIPQSTVAIVTNLGIKSVLGTVPAVQFLLQTHDSAFFQWPYTPSVEETAQQIRQAMRIPIPYSRPLTIDVAYNLSVVSWGDCK